MDKTMHIRRFEAQTLFYTVLIYSGSEMEKALHDICNHTLISEFVSVYF